MQTKKFAHHALYPVPLNSYSHFLAYGKTKPPPGRIFPLEHEENQMRGKITTAPSIALQKLGPSDQMIPFGED